MAKSHGGLFGTEQLKCPLDLNGTFFQGGMNSQDAYYSQLVLSSKSDRWQALTILLVVWLGF
jgi:hypothetical protein